MTDELLLQKWRAAYQKGFSKPLILFALAETRRAHSSLLSKKIFDLTRGEISIADSILDSLLTSLEKDDLIASTLDKNNQKYYELSKHGKEFLINLDKIMLDFTDLLEKLVSFNQAEALMNKGQYDDALQLIEPLEKRGNLTSRDLLTLHLLKGTILIKRGQYVEALSLGEQLYQESQEHGTALQMVDTLLIMVDALLHLAKSDESLAKIDQAERILKKRDPDPLSNIEFSQREAVLLVHRGNIYTQKGELQRALEYFEESLVLRKAIGNIQDIAYSLHNIGVIYRRKGDLKQAVNYLEESLTLFKELGSIQEIAYALQSTGVVYLQKGETERALEYFEESLALRKEVGNVQEIAASLHNIGTVYRRKGELKLALNHLEESLTLFKEIGNPQEIAFALHNIGGIYLQKGELQRALEYLEESLALRQRLGNTQDIAASLMDIGGVYRRKGELKPALKYLEESLALRQAIGNNFDVSATLLDLIRVTVDQASLKDVHQYLDQLQTINDSEENKIINQRYQLGKALFMKTEAFTAKALTFAALSKSLEHHITSQDLLQQIVSEEILVHDMTIEAILNLCELLITELKTCGEEDILKQVDLLTLRLFQIGQTQNMFGLLAETYLLRAKLALLEPDVERAQDLLNEAQILATEKGYDRLALVIATEQHTLTETLPNWLQDEKMPLLDRIMYTQLDSLLVAMRQDRVEYFAGEDFQTPPSMEDLKSFVSELSKRRLLWG